MTLAVLPRAGAISKPHDYKQNVQKKTGLPKKWAFTGKSLKISVKKVQKFRSSHGEPNKRTTEPQGKKLNMNHVARRKLTEAKLKKAFRMKLFELCKTRSKKSNPDLFNFYLVSAGHDMAIDAGGASTCMRNFKAPSLQTERTKIELPFKKVSFNGKSVWRFQTKNFKYSTPPTENKTKKPEKRIRIKLFELCKTTSKKSSPDLFNFYVISAGHDMAIDAGGASTCMRNFKAPSLQTERTKIELPFKKVSFNGKSVWRFQTKNFKYSTPPTENKTKKPEKRIRIKLFELCKTRSKKSNPDLFNFYLVSAGHDMAIDAGGASTCMRNFKAPSLQTERTKIELPFKKVSFNGKSVWRFQTKNFKYSTPPTENKTKKPEKRIRIKLFEICKTTSKKSSPDLFNFYVISAGHDMAIDAGGASTCMRNFKAPSLQTERTKIELPFKKVSFNGKSVWRFQTKNFKYSTPPTENKTKKPEKRIRIKLFELCKTTSKKSSPDLFNFYVISAGHDMASDAGRATTCRHKFKAPWLQLERTKNERPSEKMSFNGEAFWRFQTKKIKISTPPMENQTKEPQDPKDKNWTWTM